MLYNQIFWVVFLLFIWFDTDAFIQYSKLFRLSKFFKINSWEEYRLENKISYLDYLSIKNKNFLTKLISCRPCFSVWIVLFICTLYGSILQFPIIYVTSYILYKLMIKYVKS
jgi:hypothetical protein